MKVVACVFSWLGGIISIIIAFVYTGILTNGAGYDWLLWVIAASYAIGNISILIYRESQIRNGGKVASGVLTLIFCSLVGGILTLCIPEDQLY